MNTISSHDGESAVSESNFFNRLLVWLSAAILFLTPIFFMPFTASPVGLNKQVFFLFAVIAAFLIFFANVIRHEKLSFKFSAIYVWLAVFLTGASVSWIFSQARVDGLRIEALSLAFLPVLGYVLFSFLLGVSLRTAKDFKILFFGFVASAVIVSLYAVLRLLSFPQLDFLFPFPFLKSTAFNTLESFNSLAVFAAAAFLYSLFFDFKSGFIFINRFDPPIVSNGPAAVWSRFRANPVFDKMGIRINLFVCKNR